MYKYSFIEVIAILERELKMKLPALSILHYRLSKLDDKYCVERKTLKKILKNKKSLHSKIKLKVKKIYEITKNLFLAYLLVFFCIY